MRLNADHETFRTHNWQAVRSDFKLGLAHLSEDQLKFVSPLQKFRAENIDVAISVYCEPNPKRLTNIDPEKIKTYRASKKEIMEILFRRMAERQLKELER